MSLNSTSAKLSTMFKSEGSDRGKKPMALDVTLPYYLHPFGGRDKGHDSGVSSGSGYGRCNTTLANAAQGAATSSSLHSINLTMQAHNALGLGLAFKLRLKLNIRLRLKLNIRPKVSVQA
ncbi:hypothetical protein K2173_013140 [Erythroxylum novogranatense]|uniref:Uncharacterized protein n=1 Tax=Erythroxylum novogranatense TaxID=1862640 RepID=A0AAV8S410_9ROSI|nr:hypothetical protein K2173_013140 [Erythroxylum novogranatense]